MIRKKEVKGRRKINSPQGEEKSTYCGETNPPFVGRNSYALFLFFGHEFICFMKQSFFFGQPKTYSFVVVAFLFSTSAGSCLVMFMSWIDSALNSELIIFI